MRQTLKEKSCKQDSESESYGDTLFNFEDLFREEGIFEKGIRRKYPVNDGGVAQLGEHLPCKQGVRSSILLISTTGTRGRTKD